MIKRSTAIRRHFKNDPLFGARFISTVDNNINLLLDECEGVSNAKHISSCFSMGHIFQKIERGSFLHMLPSVLAPKRPAFDLVLIKNRKKQKSDGNENTTESTLVINNIVVTEEWKLRKDGENSFKENGNPKFLADRLFHSPGYKLCHNFAVKR